MTLEVEFSSVALDLTSGDLTRKNVNLISKREEMRLSKSPPHLPILCVSGVALKHVYEKVFTSEGGMRRNVPKVLVVVTDGRSQDEVKKDAEKLQHSGALK